LTESPAARVLVFGMGICSQISDLKKVALDQFSRGRTVSQIAEAEGAPDKLVEVLLI